MQVIEKAHVNVNQRCEFHVPAAHVVSVLMQLPMRLASGVALGHLGCKNYSLYSIAKTSNYCRICGLSIPGIRQPACPVTSEGGKHDQVPVASEARDFGNQ